MIDLCDINSIKPLLSRHGFKFSKALGQNFLCDAEVPKTIAESCGTDLSTGVLEVGPGIGALSRELCPLSSGVLAVELDRRLPALLSETMADMDNFSLVEGDILKIDIAQACRERFGDRRMVACANLPYYITTPAVTALMDSGVFDCITVMVQREVAKRMCAAPGTSDYGAFTLYIGYHAKASIVLDVPRGSFIPSPNVDSAVVRMDILPHPPVSAPHDRLFSVIKAAFSQRRKTLANCLSSYFEKIDKNDAINLLKISGFSENIRGEQLSLQDFSNLSVEIDNFLLKK